jgi:hypothetical protein
MAFSDTFDDFGELRCESSSGVDVLCRRALRVPEHPRAADHHDVGLGTELVELGRQLVEERFEVATIVKQSWRHH